MTREDLARLAREAARVLAAWAAELEAAPAEVAPSVAPVLPWEQELLSGLRPLTTEQELAKLLGVSTRTTRAWRAAGRLRGIQTAPGGRVRYAREDVARFLSTMLGVRAAPGRRPR